MERGKNMFRDDELFLPIKVYIYLTNHCHYECDYCFLKEMKMLNTKEISKEDLEKIAYYLEKYKVPLVAICGGDPILHPKLIDFVQLLSEHKNYPTIATNAVDVSYKYLYQLKSAGIRYLQIGIDSLRYSKLDNYKENGHLRKVEKTVKYLKELGILYGFATCVTRKNIGELSKIASYAKETGAELLKLSTYDGENQVYKLTEIQKEELKIFVRQYNTDGIYVRYSPVQETLNYVSEYPSLTIYANGDLAIEETGDVIGNISTSEPAVEYKKYILEKWRTNK